MPLVHPDDWKTRRLVERLAQAVATDSEQEARKAWDILTERIQYKPHEVIQLLRDAYPFTEAEIMRVIN